jgi:hypothetical protein
LNFRFSTTAPLFGCKSAISRGLRGQAECGACQGGIEWLPKDEQDPRRSISGFLDVSGLEQAIRNALERAERANPAIRSRIYQSARNALDAGLRKQDIDDPVVIGRQRQRLEATIEAIETEEQERVRLAARLEKVIIEHGTDAVEPPPAAAARSYGGESLRPAMVEMAASHHHEPSLDDDGPVATPPDDDTFAVPPPQRAGDDGSLSDLSVSRDAPMAPDKTARGPNKRKRRARHEEEDPAWAEPATPEAATISPERRDNRRRSGSIFVSVFVYAVLLGTVAAGVWWVYATGMVDAALNGSSNFDIIPKELQSEDFTPEASKSQLDPLRGFSGEWIDIFKPNGIDNVTTAASARIAPVTDSDGAAVTITSAAPDQDGEVRVEVPASILQDLAGKTSTLAITVRADGDLPAQIYIQCEFTTLGDCGRHRFTVSNERVDELIQMKFDGKLGPTDPGYVIINSDLTGEGRAIRLYGIRVLPGS